MHTIRTIAFLALTPFATLLHAQTPLPRLPTTAPATRPLSPTQRDAIAALDAMQITMLYRPRPQSPSVPVHAGTDLPVTDVYWSRRNRPDPSAGLALLQQFPELTYLHIEAFPLSPQGLAEVAKLTHLEELHLYQLSLGKAGIESLSTMTNLKHLHLSENNLTDTGIAALENLTALEELDLSGNQLSDAAAPTIAKLTRLKSLSLRQSLSAQSRMSIGDETAAKLVALTTLHDLDITNTQITDAGLAHLAPLPLETLACGGPRITDAGIATISKIGGGSIKQLILLFPDITDQSMTSIAVMTHLERLDLSCRDVTDAGLAKLQALKNLTHLSLRLHVKGFTGTGLAKLTALPLKRLDLFPIRDVPPRDFVVLPHLEALNQMKNMEELWLTNMTIDDATTDTLIQLTSLKSLTFGPQTPITPENTARLQKALPTTRLGGLRRPGSGAG